jgi:hypothetical protein
MKNGARKNTSSQKYGTAISSLPPRDRALPLPCEAIFPPSFQTAWRERARDLESSLLSKRNLARQSAADVWIPDLHAALLRLSGMTKYLCALHRVPPAYHDVRITPASRSQDRTTCSSQEIGRSTMRVMLATVDRNVLSSPTRPCGRWKRRQDRRCPRRPALVALTFSVPPPARSGPFPGGSRTRPCRRFSRRPSDWSVRSGNPERPPASFVPASEVSVTFASIRFTSPMKSATKLEFGVS